MIAEHETKHGLEVVGREVIDKGGFVTVNEYVRGHHPGGLCVFGLSGPETCFSSDRIKPIGTFCVEESTKLQIDSKRLALETPR